MPKDAKLTTPYFTDEYWKTPSRPAIDVFEPDVPFGVPFRPTPFRVTFHVKAGDADVTRELPIQFRYVKDIYNGDKRMELNVVPAFSVRVTPPLAVIPVPVAGAVARPPAREVHVTVTNGHEGKADATSQAGGAGPDGQSRPRAWTSNSRTRTSRCRRVSRSARRRR